MGFAVVMMRPMMSYQSSSKKRPWLPWHQAWGQVECPAESRKRHGGEKEKGRRDRKGFESPLFEMDLYQIFLVCASCHSGPSICRRALLPASRASRTCSSNVWQQSTFHKQGYISQIAPDGCSNARSGVWTCLIFQKLCGFRRLPFVKGCHISLNWDWEPVFEFHMKQGAIPIYWNYTSNKLLVWCMRPSTAHKVPKQRLIGGPANAAINLWKRNIFGIIQYTGSTSFFV